jgi:AcrR family transcriptional regulator
MTVMSRPHNMTDSSDLSTASISETPNVLQSNLRRKPKQKRGKERVEKILNAAAEVFDQVGYAQATTHMIAAQAETAVGTLYQFFPDKAAVFKAMEQRHIENVRHFWDSLDAFDVTQVSLRELIHFLASAVSDLFENPVSRVIFIQFFVARDAFQTIDEGMTAEAIAVMAKILKRRNPKLEDTQCNLLGEVCVLSSNALTLRALQATPPYQEQLHQQVEDLLVAYLEPYVGDRAIGNVMKVMKLAVYCPHCDSQDISKNGKRRGKQCYLCKRCRKQFVASGSHSINS